MFKLAVKIFFYSLIILTGSVSAFDVTPSKNDLKRQHKVARNLNYDGYYKEAREQYLSLLSYDSTNYFYNFELGNVLFYGTKEYELAASYYERALNFNSSPSGEIFYTLGVAHQALDHYEKAYNYYLKFEQLLKNNLEGKKLKDELSKKKAQCEFAMEQTRVDATFHVENMGDSINTEFPEYIPITNESDSVLFYTSRRPSNMGGKIDYDDELYYEDMYISFKNPQNLFYAKGDRVTRDVPYTHLLENTMHHESFVSLSYDEKTLVIYKEDKIWFSDLINNEWSKPVKFPHQINFSKHIPHLSFTNNKNTVYFSAYTRKGLLDIFRSDKNDKGEWSKPQKLPDFINTKLNEDSPEISRDGKSLYFSSNGLNGFGGYDIFKSTLDANGNWTTPINLGHPINSAGDDIYLKYHNAEKTGYFSSSRAGGKGNMDIYKFRYLVRPQFDHCVSYQNNKGYVVNFDATSTIFTGKENVTYLWNMGDGTQYEGAKISHAYKTPSKYNVTLSIRDNNTGKVKEKEQSYIINVVDFSYLNFNMFKDSLYVGEQNTFDCSRSTITGGKINFVAWDFFEDDVVLDSLRISKTYDKPGNYEAKFILDGEKDGDKFVLCQSKSFRVLEKPLPVLAEVVNPAPTEEVKAEKPPVKYEPDKSAKSEKELAIAPEKQQSKTPEKELAKAPEKEVKSKPDKVIDLGNKFDASKTIARNDVLDSVSSGIVLKTIYFDFNSSTLTKEAKKTLDQNIKILKANPKLKFNLSVHTDNKGSEEYNKVLSEDRAHSTFKYLVRRGIKSRRVSASLTLGESQPIAPNENKDGTDNPAGRALNRRVEFQIIGQEK
jgi:outer membrane protein OmpA-like peptidoglycan-associated protein/tetratricopeptide (TPR) repeat protein